MNETFLVWRGSDTYISSNNNVFLLEKDVEYPGEVKHFGNGFYQAYLHIGNETLKIWFNSKESIKKRLSFYGMNDKEELVKLDFE